MKKKNNIKLKTNIHSLRREKNISQQELADSVDCRRETIGRVENGTYNPSLQLAMKIAKVFDKPVEDIFMYVELSQTDKF